MAIPYSRTTREVARLGADFASINISNSYLTHSQVRRESQINDKSEGSLLLPLQIGNSTNNEGTMPSANTSPNLHSQIVDSPQYITISDINQHSTRMFSLSM